MKHQPSDCFDYLANRMSPEDRESFETQLNQDPELQEALEKARVVYELGKEAQEAAEYAAHPSLETIQHAGSKAPPVPRIRPLLRAVAALVILVIGSVIALESQNNETPLWAFQPPPNATGMDKTETSWIRLADGSKVAPTPTSEWAVNLQSDTRVELELMLGSLELDVESEPNREFTVLLGDVRVVVVGTRFTVRNNDTSQDVSVEKGTVRVEYGDVVSKLVAGEKWSSNSPLQPSEEDEGAAAATPATQEEIEPLPATNRGTRNAKPQSAHKGLNSKSATSKSPAGSLSEAEQPPGDSVAMREIQIPHQWQKPTQHGSLSGPKPKVGSTVEPARELGPSPLRKSVSLLNQKGCAAAIEALPAAGTLSPARKADRLYILGYCAHSKGNTTDARAHFKTMQTIDPGHPWLPTVGSWLAPEKPTATQLR